MIVTASTPAPRNPDWRPACSRTLRRLTLPLDQTVQKKKFRDRQGQGGGGGNTIAHLEEELAG